MLTEVQPWHYLFKSSYVVTMANSVVFFSLYPVFPFISDTGCSPPALLLLSHKSHSPDPLPHQHTCSPFPHYQPWLYTSPHIPVSIVPSLMLHFRIHLRSEFPRWNFLLSTSKRSRCKMSKWIHIWDLSIAASFHYKLSRTEPAPLYILLNRTSILENM